MKSLGCWESGGQELISISTTYWAAQATSVFFLSFFYSDTVFLFFMYQRQISVWDLKHSKVKNQVINSLTSYWTTCAVLCAQTGASYTAINPSHSLIAKNLTEGKSLRKWIQNNEASAVWQNGKTGKGASLGRSGKSVERKGLWTTPIWMKGKKIWGKRRAYQERKNSKTLGLKSSDIRLKVGGSSRAWASSKSRPPTVCFSWRVHRRKLWALREKLDNSRFSMFVIN